MATSPLTADLWYHIEKLLPRPIKKPYGPGRPACDFQQVLSGIIWVLKSGARWKDLPQDYPSYQTCHRRFQQWSELGLFRKIHSDLVKKASREGKIDLSESYIDGSYVPAKKGGTLVKSSTRGIGSKIVAIIDRNRNPISLEVTSANFHDVRFVEPLIRERLLRNKVSKIIGDKAFDSDPLDRKLRRRGIELIAPNRDWKLVKTQDKRKLRRIKRRWSIERFFAHLKNYRRIAIRWECKAQNYLSMVHLACICVIYNEF